MESPSTAPWWRTVAARIEAEPLTLICAELGADPEQVLQALLDGDRPAQLSQASWWPELQRRSVAGEPIRSLARRFRLEPRRVRRACRPATPSAALPSAWRALPVRVSGLADRLVDGWHHLLCQQIHRARCVFLHDPDGGL